MIYFPVLVPEGAEAAVLIAGEAEEAEPCSLSRRVLCLQAWYFPRAGIGTPSEIRPMSIRKGLQRFLHDRDVKNVDASYEGVGQVGAKVDAWLEERDSPGIVQTSHSVRVALHRVDYSRMVQY